MSDQIPKQYTIKQPPVLLSVQHDVESLADTFSALSLLPPFDYITTTTHLTALYPGQPE